MTKNITIGVLAAVAIVFGVLTVKAPSVVTVERNVLQSEAKAPVVNVQVPEQKAPVVNVNVPKQAPVLGAVTNPENYDRFFFNSGLTTGGTVSTSSTASSYTTAASDFRGTPSVILWTPNVNTTVTLNATSTFAYVPKVGDVAEVMILNASSTAASSITLAAQNSSVDLQYVEATGGDLVLNGLDWARLTLVRQTANKVTVIFTEFIEAD